MWSSDFVIYGKLIGVILRITLIFKNSVSCYGCLNGYEQPVILKRKGGTPILRELTRLCVRRGGGVGVGWGGVGVGSSLVELAFSHCFELFSPVVSRTLSL